MYATKQSKFLSKAFLVGPAAVTLAVYSQGVTDPVNVTKFFAIGVFSIGVFATFTFRSFRDTYIANRIPSLTLSLFLFAALISLFSSPSPITQSLYGVYGRNNGFLLYLFLVLIFFTALSISQVEIFDKIIISLFISGFINVIYCLWVIFFGDFIGWSNPYGNILGTLGNPNFIGAFLGMFSSVIFTYIFSNIKNLRLVFSMILLQTLVVFEIFQSHAVQGRVLFVAGLCLNMFYFLRSRVKTIIPQFLFLGLVFTGFVIATLGTLQRGPLTDALYKDSVSLRGQYWYAGIQMGKANLLTGVGFDSYGDWFRTFRRSSALVRPGVDTVSNTAHNVLIDIFSFGGLGLLCSYMFLLGTVFIACIKFTKDYKDFDFIFISLFGAWLMYQLQSLISINQIGLSIWGWVLGGALLSYIRVKNLNEKTKMSLKNPVKNYTSKNEVLTPQFKAGIAMVLGALISCPPLSADMKWRAAQESRNAAQLELSLKPGFFNPPSSFKYVTSVGQFEQSGLYDLAKKYSIKAIEFNPHNYESWRLFTLISSATELEKQIALKKMKNLDPLNPNIVELKK